MKTFVTYVSLGEGPSKAPVTVQVKDTSCGTAVDGLPLTLSRKGGTHNWELVEEGLTNCDGVASFTQTEVSAVYKLSAQTHSYFTKMGIKSSLPSIQIIFETDNDRPNIFIALNMSAFGYNVTVEI